MLLLFHGKMYNKSVDPTLEPITFHDVGTSDLYISINNLSLEFKGCTQLHILQCWKYILYHDIPRSLSLLSV